jgi:glycerol-3-phosphate acyltransferase PlsY
MAVGDLIATFEAAYLLGSIPFGLILTRLMGAGDLRQIGSGNIGATTVLRTGRKGLAAATLLLDMGKGALAVLAASWLSNDDCWVTAFAGLAAMVGHCFPVWLRFRGGKGVATMLGVSLALDWRIGLCTLLVWLVAARLTRISSVGGMGAAVAAPVAAWLISMTHGGVSGMFTRVAFAVYALALALMAVIVIFQHRANIARLRAGTEPKMGRKG